MTKKPSRKPSKAKPIDANESYEYEYSPDGERLKFRFMSHRERDRLLSTLMFLVIGHVNAFAAVKQKMLASSRADSDVPPMTSKYLNEQYQPLHEEVCSLVEKIGIGDAAKVVSEWNDPGDYDVIAQLVMRIVNVEQALNAKQDVPTMEPYPTPEAILELSNEEAEELGEGSPPSINQSGTSPSGAQAETSSSGAKSTTE